MNDCNIDNKAGWPYPYTSANWGDNGGCYGSISADGFYSYTNSCSDRRIKQSIKTLENSLEKILQLDVVEYDWNNKLGHNEYLRKINFNKIHSIGLIAQNVKEFFPTIVNVSSDGFYTVDYIKMNAVLIEGIKEQQVFIDDIGNEIKELEKLLS